MRHLRLLVLAGGILTIGRPVAAADLPSIQSSYFPLSLGNEWVYAVYNSLLDSTIRQDTVRIDDVDWSHGKIYYHLSTPWYPLFSSWVHSDTIGDLYWCNAPGSLEHPLVLFSADQGEGWLLGQGFCIDSTSRVPCPASVQTPAGSFSELACFSCVWRPGDCSDVGWSVSFAQGVGPVERVDFTIGAATPEWQLSEFHPAAAVACNCHGDPVCDGSSDIRDVVSVIEVAFRGVPPLVDRGCSWYAHAMHGRSDVDCSGTTDIIDVISIIDVVLRGVNPTARFCKPGAS